MLTIDDLSVARGSQTVIHSLSLSLATGKTLAIVGESGAGKSTLIAAILGLAKPTSGRIQWNGAPVAACRPALVMQEPRAAFNPALPLKRSVLEPTGGMSSQLVARRLERLCRDLDLSEELLDRRPGNVSIGQAQRAGILRALIAAPPLILFDEPLSALDAATQKQTAKLISELQKDEGFAALIVTHDLGYAAAYADHIAVLRAGRIEEVGSAKAFVESPDTSYGRALRDAAMALGALGQAA